MQSNQAGACAYAGRSADGRRRVDIHHHCYPPEYVAIVEQRKNTPLRRWSVADSLEEMDRTGTDKAVLSVAPPGVFLGDTGDAGRIARLWNDYAASLGRQHSGRFGLFAALPLPDVDASLKEIAYALDVLGADGIGIMTSYGDKWPGDPLFAPVFDELNRRKAVVFVHPHTPDCCADLMSYVSSNFIERPHDLSRAVLSLLFGGVLARCRNIRFVFANAGGTVPMLAGRIINLASSLRSPAKASLPQVAPHGIDHELKRLFYDIANSTSAPAMAALRAFVPISQIVFGTGYPILPMSATLQDLARLGMPEAELRAIEDNAQALLVPCESAATPF